MKVSFITTVLNEESSIESFLNSISKQSVSPNEIIIVDGGSNDNTTDIIRDFSARANKSKININLIIKKGNRAVGRNEAIKVANGDIIACSDAGNTLDTKWIKNIIEPFKKIKKVEVVAGYYKGNASTTFEKCLVPYVLLMPDRVDEREFLPATRSIAFKKKVWEKFGGFEEKFSHNEDYLFSRKLKENNVYIVFSKNAVVYWTPRKNFKESFTMFFRFALGDAEANILRPKVILIFIRYFIGVLLFLAVIYLKSLLLMYVLILTIITYLVWAILKNYKYVKNYKAIYILPTIQFISDGAIILGTAIGITRRINFG